MEHNSILKRLLIMIAMVCVLLTAMAFVVTASAEVQPGIDLVILLDSSKSMSDAGYGQYDKEYKRLDAAVLMINMCDSSQSRVAVVPFTNQVSYDSPWCEMIDISSMRERESLCNAVINCKTFDSTGGMTAFANALSEAERLLTARQNEGSTNLPVVLLLSDGKNEVSGDQSKSVEIAARLKSELGADIYCVYLGPENSGAVNNLNAIASSRDYVHIGANTDIVGFFSDIFAGLIDSRIVPGTAETVSIDGKTYVDIPINVPNNSVYEINLTFPTSNAANGTDIDVFYLDEEDNPMEPSSESCYVYQYRDDNDEDTRFYFDHYCIKLIRPNAAEWHIRFLAPEDFQNVSFTYDVLYNYDVNLAGSVRVESSDTEPEGDVECLLNDNLVLNAWFVQTNGNLTNDAYMYDIPATYTISVVNPDGTERVVFPVNTDDGRMDIGTDANGNVCYVKTISVEDLKNALGTNFDVYGTYIVRFHAEDETMFRDSINEVSFSIVNAAPERTTEENIDLGVIRIDDVLDRDTQDGKIEQDVSGYFDSVDGDTLSYVIVGQSEGDNAVTASLDGATLTITKAGDGTVTDGWVEVVAVDPQGSHSEPVRFNVKVLSVRQLVDECVTIHLKVETESTETAGEYIEVLPAGVGSYSIPKGQSIRLTAEYVIAVPNGKPAEELPYSKLGEIVTEDAVRAVAAVGYSSDNDNEETAGPSLAAEDNSYTAVLASGETAEASMTVGFSADIGGVAKSIDPLTFIVTNADPTLNEETARTALTELGGIEEPVDANAPDGGKIIFFDVDRDDPDDRVLTFDVSQWFADSDTVFGSEALSYSVEIQPLEETKDIFSFARKILRTIGMADKEGEIVTLDGAAYDKETGVVAARLGESNGELKLDAKRFGNATVTVTATDKSEAEISYQFGYHVTSSQEQLKCLIVYAIMLLILIIIIIILINRLIVHAKWFTGNNSRYEVILNGYNQFSNRGEQASKFNKTGRKAITLRELAKQFDIQDGGSGNALFSAIRLWPTTGGRIVVEGPKRKPRDGEVLVDGRKLGTKAKWSVRGSLTCKYKDGDGVEHTCVFKRV